MRRAPGSDPPTRRRLPLGTKLTLAFLVSSVAAAFPGALLVSFPGLAAHFAYQTASFVLPLLTFSTSLLFGALVGRRLGDGLNRRLGAIVQHATRLREGDLRSDLAASPSRWAADETDDLGEAMRAITVHLRALVRTTREAADHVADAAEVLSGTARETSLRARRVAFTVGEAAQGVAEHAAGVARTREAIAELARALDESARAVGITRDASERSAHMASIGREVAAQTLGRAEAVFRDLDSLSGRVYRFGEHTEEIHQIALMIRDISRQTDVLAINAGIELARRREPDPGLGHIADEVRRLADRAARATTAITRIASGVEEESRQVVQAMRAGGAEIQAGRGELANISAAMARITTLVDEAAEKTLGVADLAERQRRGALDLLRAVEDVSRRARENAVATDEVHRTVTGHSDDLRLLAGEAEELMALARGLRERIGAFAEEGTVETAEEGAATGDAEEEAAAPRRGAR